MKNKTHSYFVVGSNWVGEVTIENPEDIPQDIIRLEAATRAVEARYGKRNDVRFEEHKPELTCENAGVSNTLIELMTDELEEGCGVGMLICVMDMIRKQSRIQRTMSGISQANWFWKTLVFPSWLTSSIGNIRKIQKNLDNFVNCDILIPVDRIAD